MMHSVFRSFKWKQCWTAAVAHNAGLPACKLHTQDYKMYFQNPSKLTLMNRSLLSNEKIFFLPKSHLHLSVGDFKQERKTPLQEKKYRPFFTWFYEEKDEWKLKARRKLEKYSMESLVNKTPDSVQPYLKLARIDKPTGTLLLYIPCALGICFATPPGEWPSFYYLALFGLGSFLMRGAGCVINDLWDKDFDKQVERTKTRPIAAGEISEKNAIKLLAGQLTLSLGILLSLNPTCILIGVASMGPVIAYPLAKRFTMVPQAALGLTFNVGALMGYAAVAPPNWLLMFTLYASCFMWTMYYDTIYAFQDIEDDRKAGVKSISLLFRKYSEKEKQEMSMHNRFGENEREINRIKMFLWLSGSLHLTMLFAAGDQKFLDGPFYLALIIAFGRILCQVSDLNLGSTQCYWKAFNENPGTGLILVLGVILAIWMQKINSKESQGSRKQ